MKSIKLWDGINVITDDETVFCKSPCEIWDLFGWDIENDKQADECARIITTELYCFGSIDLSAMNNGKKLLLEVVPVKD